MYAKTIIVAAALAGTALAAPASGPTDPVKAVSVETLHDFGPGRFIENLALRPLRAGIITTSVNSPNLTLYEFTTKQTCTIANFGNSTSSGITADPRAPDAYFINSNTPVPGSSSFTDIVPGAGRVFRVDLHGATCATLSHALLQPTLVARVPQSGLLNGAAALPGPVLAISDSSKQLIWRIDPQTGHVDVLLNDTTTQAPPDPTTGATLGVNGIRARAPDLFYVNSNTAGYFRLPTTPDGRAAGAPTQLGGLGIGADDFALAASPQGLYYAAGFNNTVAYNDGRGGRSVQIAGLAGPTSAVRDVDAGGRTVLYVSSTGGDDAYFRPPVTVHGLLSKITLA